MFKDFFRSKYFITILVSAIVVIIMVFFLKNHDRVPSLVSVNPASGFSKLSVIKPITLVFNQDVSPKDILVTSNPPAEFNIVNGVSAYHLLLSPVKPLIQNTPYTITISYKNQPLHTLSYKTEETQTDYELIDQIKGEIARDYPLADKIPYETASFKVVYSAPLTLEIRLKNSTLSQDAAISQVKSWVSSNGVDVENHKYVVVPFSQ